MSGERNEKGSIEPDGLDGGASVPKNDAPAISGNTN